MKLTFVSLLAVAGLAAAIPTAQSEDEVSIFATPGSSCSGNGRINCSDSDGQRYPHILVCLDQGSGYKWQIQATCASGTSCAYDSNNNWAWCEAY